MNETNLRNLDLNLLYILHVLLEEKNVTRTANRLALSQSAISHSLRKLRTYFNDPLLVKTKREMVPTTVAEQLTGKLRIAIEQIEGLTRGERFDPSQASANIKVAVSDYGASIILPRLIEKLSKVAPRINIDCSTLSTYFEQDLENGLIDLSFGAYKPFSNLANEIIFHDRYIGLVRSGHPILKKGITKKSLSNFKHSFIKVPAYSRRKDEIFKTLGIKLLEGIQVHIPYYIVAPLIAERSDLILIMPEMGARQMAQMVDVTIFDLPIKTLKYPYYQTWHPRRQDDQLHQWLRNQIKDVCKNL